MPLKRSHSAPCDNTSLSVKVSTIAQQRRHCAFCSLLWDGATAVVGPNFYQVYDSFDLVTALTEDEGPMRIDLLPSHRDPAMDYLKRVRLQYYRLGCDEVPWPDIQVGFHIGTNGAAQSVIDLAKTWIGRCTSRQGKHIKCDYFDDRFTPLPSRILDLSESSGDVVKLRVTTPGETGKYIALSHCWGGITPVMTTKQNIEVFMECIDRKLPQTFADAIIVTKALGVHYLWIDSLCIIQDSLEDWALQAPKMAQVYGGAYVTIAADAATDSTTGFLSDINRDRNISKKLPFLFKGNKGVVYVRERGALAYQLPYHDWPGLVDPGVKPREAISDIVSQWSRSKDPPQSRLSTRGWVFQERVLPPRTLHFGPAELGWECRSTISCECSENKDRRSRNTGLLKRAVVDLNWKTVVEEYTQMNLTIKEDRLMALAGLIDARALGRKDQCVAGMWTADLTKELLWYATKPGERLNIAPRWSWASTTSAVRFHYNSAQEQLGSPSHELYCDERKLSRSTTIATRSEPQQGVLKILRMLPTPTELQCTLGTRLVVQGHTVCGRAWKTASTVKPRHGTSQSHYVPEIFRDYWLRTQRSQIGPEQVWMFQPEGIDNSVSFLFHWDSVDDQLLVDGLTSTGSRIEFTIYMVLTANFSAGPAGLVLLKEENSSISKQSDSLEFLDMALRRIGFFTAKHPHKTASWSDDESSDDPEDEPNNTPKWELWKKQLRLHTFSIS